MFSETYKKVAKNSLITRWYGSINDRVTHLLGSPVTNAAYKRIQCYMQAPFLHRSLSKNIKQSIQF